MTIIVLLAVLCAALAHAIWNALLKSGADPVRRSVGLALSWMVVGVPLLLVVPFPGKRAVPLLAATVLVHVAYFSLLARAYRSSDFAVVYPFARGLPPVLVLAVSVLLGEDRASLSGVAGVCLVSAGIASLAHGIAAPHRAGAWFAGATALLVAAYTIIDGIGVRRATSPVAFTVWLAAVWGFVYTAGAVALRGRAILPQTRSELAIALTSGILAGCGYFVVLWAMARAPIALVSAVRETGVLFGALIGVIFFREPLGARRVVSAALIATGIVVIQLAD
jgi:drug/metabolite transporter (DMT)-like permease